MRLPRLSGVISLLLGLCLVLAACGDDRDGLGDTVRRYCLLLAAGYQSGDMSALPHVATDAETARLRHHMAALAEARLRMEAKLLTIEWQSISREGADTAQVTSKEDWDYRYVNLDSGQEVQANTIHYQARYHLTQVDRRWLVNSVDILETREEKSLPPLPFLQRPTHPKSAPENTNP